MSSFWAGIKTVYTIIKLVKESISMIKEIYALKLKHERDAQIAHNNEIADRLRNEIHKPINEQSDEELKEILRSKLGL